MPVNIRMAEDEVDAILAYRIYEKMHGEGCVPGKLDPVKTLTNLLRFVQGPGSVVWLAMDGEAAIGVLTVVESAFWYSTADTCLEDKGLYVLPSHRGGDASKLLLEEAKALSNKTGLDLFISIFNEKRKRGGRSEWERIGATLGFTPRGAVLAHIPEK